MFEGGVGDAPSMATVPARFEFSRGVIVPSRTPVGSPPSQSEVVAGEEEPVMAVAEVHERPATTPTVSPDEILSKARSRVSKLEAAIQILDGEDPALGRVAGGLAEGQESSESTLSRRPGCVNRALHHPREEESRRCRSQSGRRHCGPRQVAHGIGGWRAASCAGCKTS